MEKVCKSSKLSMDSQTKACHYLHAALFHFFFDSMFRFKLLTAFTFSRQFSAVWYNQNLIHSRPLAWDFSRWLQTPWLHDYFRAILSLHEYLNRYYVCCVFGITSFTQSDQKTKLTKSFILHFRSHSDTHTNRNQHACGKKNQQIHSIIIFFKIRKDIQSVHFLTQLMLHCQKSNLSSKGKFIIFKLCNRFFAYVTSWQNMLPSHSQSIMQLLKSNYIIW